MELVSGWYFRMKKNAIFAGCSFTWGQGLWSYLETKQHVPSYEEWIFENKPLADNSREIRENLRFPKLVSDELNLHIISKIKNGGTDEESVEFIDYIFDKTKDYNSIFPQEKYNYTDIDLCVYQTTQLSRSGIRFIHNDEMYYVKSTPDNRAFDFIEKIIINENGNQENIPQKNLDILFEYMYHNDLDIEDVLKDILITTVDKIEKTLKKLHENLIKVFVFSWSDEYLNEFQKRDFFKDKFVKLKYQEKEYMCLEYLFKEHPHLMLMNDKTVLHKTGLDMHPSKECHEVIAKSILEKYYNG